MKDYQLQNIVMAVSSTKSNKTFSVDLLNDFESLVGVCLIDNNGSKLNNPRISIRDAEGILMNAVPFDFLTVQETISKKDLFVPLNCVAKGRKIYVDITVDIIAVRELNYSVVYLLSKNKVKFDNENYQHERFSIPIGTIAGAKVKVPQFDLDNKYKRVNGIYLTASQTELFNLEIVNVSGSVIMQSLASQLLLMDNSTMGVSERFLDVNFASKGNSVNLIYEAKEILDGTNVIDMVFKLTNKDE